MYDISSRMFTIVTNVQPDASSTSSQHNMRTGDPEGYGVYFITTSDRNFLCKSRHTWYIMIKGRLRRSIGNGRISAEPSKKFEKRDRQKDCRQIPRHGSDLT